MFTYVHTMYAMYVYLEINNTHAYHIYTYTYTYSTHPHIFLICVKGETNHAYNHSLVTDNLCLFLRDGKHKIIFFLIYPPIGPLFSTKIFTIFLYTYKGLSISWFQKYGTGIVKDGSLKYHTTHKNYQNLLQKW